MKALTLSMTQSMRSIPMRLSFRLWMAWTALMALMAGALPAYAISKTDLTQDQAGGKKFEDMAENIDNAGQVGATLIIGLVSIGGFVVVAISLYTLWRASKDERERPLSAIVGLFIGGAMAGVGVVMWMMRNTVVGT